MMQCATTMKDTNKLGRMMIHHSFLRLLAAERTDTDTTVKPLRHKQSRFVTIVVARARPSTVLWLNGNPICSELAYF